MICKDIIGLTPVENILYDEVLLTLAEQGQMGEVLRFWESPETFIVLGKISKAEEDVFFSATRTDRIPVLRRFSGGGTVLQGKGCLNYTLILAKELHPTIHDLHGSYRFIFSKILQALQVLGIQAEYQLTSDLVLKDSRRKFSGNAQHRRKKFILHHGTILCDFDLPLMEKYLRMPKAIPVYRGDRSHKDFIVNLHLSPARIKQELMNVFHAHPVIKILSQKESELLQTFVSTKSVELAFGV